MVTLTVFVLFGKGRWARHDLLGLKLPFNGGTKLMLP